MTMITKQFTILVLIAGSTLPAAAGKKGKEPQEETTGQGPALMWRDPGNPSTRDLRYGIGGVQHKPSDSTYTFVKESTGGSNPKFVVKDAKGVEWRVKLGPEARPEVVASRFVWAVGYFTDEDYFVPKIRVKSMPRLKRGDSLVGRTLASQDSVVRDVRLEREIPEMSKLRSWKWKKDSFYGAREWNGLRVMMALINNWDLKDVNNAVYQQAEDSPDARQLYLVSDLGASFGTAVPHWPVSKSRGNLDEYAKSRFIRNVTPAYVDFQTPGRPGLIYLFNPPELINRLGYRYIGRQVPRRDVRWIAGFLGRLTPRQIRDAFRAADYPQEAVEQFAVIIERRIAALREL